jgi:hypothetical protein
MAFAPHAFTETAFLVSSTLGKAHMVARLGLMRLGASRLGYYQPIPRVHINAVNRTGNVRVSGLRVTDYLDGQPNTATFRVSGFTPTRGHEVKIGLGNTVDPDQLVFAGHILNTTQVWDTDDMQHVAWDVQCISYEWLLNRLKVNGKFLSESATTIILSIMADYTSGFDVSGVENDLPQIDEIQFTDEDVTQAFDRIMRRVGGSWKVSDAKVLHAFLTVTEAVHPITDADVIGMQRPSITVDDSQRRNRIILEGGGSNTSIPVTAGSTVLSVDDTQWYGVSGGYVKVGQQRIAYGGVSSTSSGSEASSTPLADATNMLVVGAVGGALAVGLTARYKVTFTTSAGETLAGPPSVAVTLAAGQGQFSVGSTPTPAIGIPTGPSGVTGRKLYRQDNLTGAYRSVQTIANNTTTAVLDANTAPGAAEPAGDTSALGPLFVEARSTSLPVLDTAPFDPTGGLLTVGSQIVSFTGRSVASGAGSLTGIPSSGFGSLAVRIQAGTPVLPTPQLTGIPASGEGAILYDIPQGEPVNILVIADDTDAQLEMATALGSADPEDGVFEEVLKDNRLSIVGATERAEARLTEVKDPHREVRYLTFDQTTRSGKSVTFSLGDPVNLSGTFKIQSVTIENFDPAGRTFPIRTVEASSRRLSFEAILRMIQQQAGAA